MSLKDLFKEEKNLKSAEPLSKDDFKEELESFDYATAIQQRDERYLAIESFQNPTNFARFGSAEKYYEDSISRIYNTYPYDGSLKEKIQWEVSSSLVDVYLFKNGYPRTTGYAVLSPSVVAYTDYSDHYGAAGTSSYEYIFVKGGPHQGTGNSLYYNYRTDEVTYRKDANIYDIDNNRECNLKIGGTDGNTVEFWMKKSSFATTATGREVIFDNYTIDADSSNAGYGRLTIRK